MRLESSITGVSRIPLESMYRPFKAAYFIRVTHYDDPPPEVIDTPAEPLAVTRFRFANHLAAWIDAGDAPVVDAVYTGRGYIPSTDWGRAPGCHDRQRRRRGRSYARPIYPPGRNRSGKSAQPLTPARSSHVTPRPTQ